MDSWVWDLIGGALTFLLLCWGLAGLIWADRKPAPRKVVHTTRNFESYTTIERARREVADAADKLDNQAVAPSSQAFEAAARDPRAVAPTKGVVGEPIEWGPYVPPKPIEIPRDASAIKPRAKRAYAKRTPAKSARRH